MIYDIWYLLSGIWYMVQGMTPTLSGGGGYPGLTAGMNILKLWGRGQGRGYLERDNRGADKSERVSIKRINGNRW